jgi:hypothetical protein
VTKKSLPPFKKITTAAKYSSPEELFSNLTRVSSHGYLRGQQQDVLRSYAEDGVDASDVAFELPTGTGKTAVGLLIAEWKRRMGQKAAYLALTNQLAGQVLLEASKLGISTADLRGTKATRDQTEVGRYLTGNSVAVTTYSNLFNAKPIINGAEILVLDDAHGGEHYVSDMWSVGVGSKNDGPLYSSLLAALRPALSDAQFSEVTESRDFGVVQIADTVRAPECIPPIREVLDQAKGDIQFAWQRIRAKLQACLFLLSPFEITIRPLIPPTHEHSPFADANQRIYLSATLGSVSDLQRGYGVRKIFPFRAQNAKGGRRYVFVPGLYTDLEQSFKAAAKLWDELPVRRAVVIAPSDRVLQKGFKSLSSYCKHKPSPISATDISDSLDPFVKSADVMLTLAGRYDGLDLPGDDCRFLILIDSPAALDPLERHLMSKWKLGPITRRRERIRLIQGMGRCTRSATDYAIVMWLGQSLVNVAASTAMTAGMPAELQDELQWGTQQVVDIAKSLQKFLDMTVGLIEDQSYRSVANDQIGALSNVTTASKDELGESGEDEVKFSRAMWGGDYGSAFEMAKQVADHATSPNLTGYRGWWWYLASVAASLAGNQAAEIDALIRCSKVGIHTGFATGVLSKRTAGIAKAATSSAAPVPSNIEGIWDLIEDWGWAGPNFDEKVSKLQSFLGESDHTSFHQGLELLGSVLGATPLRSTEQGAPDVVWSFGTAYHFGIEAKTEKKSDGFLFKKDLQEAKGHREWIAHKVCPSEKDAVIRIAIVSPTAKLDAAAEPFAEGLYYLPTDSVRKFANDCVSGLRQLRSSFSGSEYSNVVATFTAEVRAFKLDFDSILKFLTANPLKA